MAYGRSASVKQMCPSICSGLDRHVARIGNAEQLSMPPGLWAKKPEDYAAFYCSYCGTVWFKGHGPHATKVGRWSGGVFTAMPIPETVYMHEYKLTVKKASPSGQSKRPGNKRLPK